MTLQPPWSPPPSAPARAGRSPRRWLPAVALVVVLWLLIGPGGVRSWWAHRVHDLTGGSRWADYLLGLLVGLLPVIGIAVGAAVGRRRGSRFLALVAGGAAGFAVAYLLSPSLAALAAGHGQVQVFSRLAPLYLPGVYTGVALWVAALLLGVRRFRRSWRDRRIVAVIRRPGPP